MNKAIFFANCALILILSACGTYVLIGNTAASPAHVGTVEVVHDEVEIEYFPAATVTVVEGEVEMIFVPAS